MPCIYWRIIHSASWINLTNRPMKFLVEEEKNTHYVRMFNNDMGFGTLCYSIAIIWNSSFLLFITSRYLHQHGYLSNKLCYDFCLLQSVIQEEERINGVRNGPSPPYRVHNIDEDVVFELSRPNIGWILISDSGTKVNRMNS